MLKKLKAKSKKNEKGFTLIELLAVIVILAILAAIAIPSVTAIINNQKEKAAVQDGLTIIHAAKLYVAENNITEDSEADEKTMDQTKLEQYIEDSTSELPANYSVTVSFADGEATYTLTDDNLPDDDSFTDDDGATEQDLLNYNN